MMRTIIAFLFCIIFVSVSFAEDTNNTIRIGIDRNDPPFIYSINNKTFYGFDIDMMTMLCTYLKKKCDFVPMNFSELLPSVRNKTVDIAASSIFITPERAQFVNFSIPYLLSYTHFIGTKDKANVPFLIDSLSNKRIGYERGTLIPDVILSLGIINPVLVAYNNTDDVVEGLLKNEVDYALFTQHAAYYWNNNSAGQLTLLGNRIPFGLGVGIAVNKDKPELLMELNQALKVFQNSEAYKNNYNRYIAGF